MSGKPVSPPSIQSEENEDYMAKRHETGYHANRSPFYIGLEKPRFPDITP